MLQKTHSLAGLLAAEGVILSMHVPLLSWESAAALMIGCIAGPMADVDKPGSIMAKVLFPLASLLRAIKIRHRTMTHSILFLIAIGLLLSPVPDLFKWTFLIAYASHPTLDLFNIQGVALLWPMKKKFRILPKSLSIETGSAGELIFRGILIGFMVWMPSSHLFN
ncbi:metal-dependent hydrolase [Paenibacillus sp. N1-5-1-14]|uniref:metal-dependent hydrolase n=1 Tax=Paenibacillus radicibacter TaxID=2972488 RepID=UPI002158F66F|nr:metal-dependent hydrolase [Paenibacillus radicibacter]MCR8644796.1 metal-dependent hydrolase [Paenibacillus radicibacter]